MIFLLLLWMAGVSDDLARRYDTKVGRYFTTASSHGGTIGRSGVVIAVRNENRSTQHTSGYLLDLGTSSEIAGLSAKLHVSNLFFAPSGVRVPSNNGAICFACKRSSLHIQSTRSDI